MGIKPVDGSGSGTALVALRARNHLLQEVILMLLSTMELEGVTDSSEFLKFTSLLDRESNAHYPVRCSQHKFTIGRLRG